MENIEQSLGLTKDNIDFIARGHRLLSHTGIPEEDIGVLIKEFKNINQILALKLDQTQTFFNEEKGSLIIEKIELLKNN